MKFPIKLSASRSNLWPFFACGLPLILCGCGGSSSSTNSQTAYQITDLSVLPSDVLSSASAINSKGQVAGTSTSATSVSHAFLYNGSLTALGTLPGGTEAQASGINTAGQVVGTADTSTRFQHAFLYSSGKMQDLGVLPGDTNSIATNINTQGQFTGYSQLETGNPPAEAAPNYPTHAFIGSGTALTGLGALPGDASSFAAAINDQGQIAGTSFTSSGPDRAFLATGGTLKDLGTPGGMYSFAAGINSKGQVVGSTGIYTPTQVPPFATSTTQYAFLYSGVALVNLGTLPGDTSSAAQAINDTGQVVGISNSPGTQRAFLYSNGTMTDLNTLLPPGSGWVLYEATGINNAGQICGNGEHNGHPRAFLLSH